MSTKILEASYQDTDLSATSSAYDDELTNVSSLSSSIMMLSDEDTTLLADSTSLCQNCRSVFASAWVFLVLTGILGIDLKNSKIYKKKIKKFNKSIYFLF